MRLDFMGVRTSTALPGWRAVPSHCAQDDAPLRRACRRLLENLESSREDRYLVRMGGLGKRGEGLGWGGEENIKKKRKKPSAFFLQHSGKRMFHRGLERRNFFTSKWIAISLHLAPEGN